MGKENKLIEIPEGVVLPSHVLRGLQQVTWPHCFSRENVRPDGNQSIEAFPMGFVKAYTGRICKSISLNNSPNLAILINKFMSQEASRFSRWTTIQCNKNYAAKLHVDHNNTGPSAIIALGDYDGGELWLYDP